MRSHGIFTFVAAAGLAAGLVACTPTVVQEIAEPTPLFTSVEAMPAETPTATPTEKPKEKPSSPPVCYNALLPTNSVGMQHKFFDCEGGFAYAGVPSSDEFSFLRWDGNQWGPLLADGHVEDTKWGEAPCWDTAHMRDIGVPETILVKMRKCPSGKTGFDEFFETAPKGDPSSPYITLVNLGEAGEAASYPACDGRNILILDSVIDNEPDTAHKIARQVLAVHPSGRSVKFMVPGRCASLRGQLDGDDIYPVYLDFLSDVDEMCRAKAQYGGNGRVLVDRAEYFDPC